MWRPLRIVSTKFRSVHRPSPVSASGVRLAVKLTPHGPAHAVLVPAAVTSHGPGGSCGAGGMASVSGCPESMRVMSGAGPDGPTFHGVWQSLHPAIVTRYLPRETLSVWTGL